jgi:hypothetical protein
MNGRLCRLMIQVSVHAAVLTPARPSTWQAGRAFRGLSRGPFGAAGILTAASSETSPRNPGGHPLNSQRDRYRKAGRT